MAAMPRLRIPLILLCTVALAACGSHATANPSLAPGQTQSAATDATDAPDAGATDTPDAGPTDDGIDELPSIDPNATFLDVPSLEVQLDQASSAQFAGVFAAADEDINPDGQSFYEAEQVDVLVDDPTPGHDPIALASSPDGPEFFIGPAAAVLVARDRGADLVNIAQIFQRSGMRIVALASSGITSVAQLKGKRLLVLDHGRDADATIALQASGLDPKKDVRLSHEDFDPDLLASGAVNAAQVSIQDEYAQLLETVNPKTDQLYDPAALTLIDLSTPALATLQDGIYARASWLAQPGNEDVAVRFLRATLRGWIYCRDHFEDCAQLVSDTSSATAPTQHQRWVLNESEALIWPSAAGIGALDTSAWDHTAQAALGAGLLKAAPSADAARSDLLQQALSGLSDLDTKGAAFAKANVRITPGGEDPQTP